MKKSLTGARQRTISFALKVAALLVGINFLAACAVTPKALDASELGIYAQDKMDRVTAGQEPITHSISLYEAIARALKYNLDQKVELVQQTLRVKELNLSNYSGLPSFVANSGYAGRSNDYGSTSISLLSQKQSLEASTGQERQDLASDVTLSWNILDFGLSYVRAQQASDQVLIAGETRRKVLSRIVEDVRTAYWRAVTSEHLVARLHSLEARTKRAIVDSHKLFEDKLTSPVTALTYERELIEIQREAQRIDGELKIARSQLAALMNLPPDARYSLNTSHGGAPALHLGKSTRELVKIALENRSEMREVIYKTRINAKEAEAALLGLLPGINVFLGVDADTNKYLYNSNWIGWGAKASWNLMKVFQYPQTQAVIDGQDRLLDERALALTMAVMTQVHVSRVRFAHAQDELKTAGQYKDVQHKLIEQMRASAQTDKISEQTLIREEMNLVVGDVKYDLAYANVQNAYANIFASLGLDAFPADDIGTTSVKDLAGKLRKTWVALGNLSVIKPIVPESISPIVAASK